MQNSVLDQAFIIDISAQLVEAAERAVFEPGAWDDFVEILGSAFPGTCVLVQRSDLRRNRFDYARILNMEPDYEVSYRDYYCSLNPWIQHMRSIPPGSVMVSERDFPSVKFRNAEFYDWLRPEMRAGAGIVLEESRENLAAIALQYGIDRSDRYDRSIGEVLRATSRPLLRSVQAARLFEQTVDRERSVAAIASRSGDVACVVDSQLRVKEANARAEDEFQRRKVVSMRAGTFSVLPSDVNGWLTDTLGLLAAGLEPRATTRVFFADGAHQIGIVPLPGRTGVRSPFSDGPLFLLILRHLVAPASSGTLADLANAFGLTPAEQRLCEALALGHSLKDAADMLGVTSDTARQRLKVIFQKTDTHKQSELIALLGRLL